MKRFEKEREWSWEFFKKSNKYAKRKKVGNVEYFTGVSNARNKPTLMLFTGRRSKADAHYFYNSKEDRDLAIARYVNRDVAWEARKEAKREERKTNLPEFKVGDVFHDSWGYEQTNNNFYEVVEVVSKHFAVLREVYQEQVPGNEGPMSNYVKPSVGNYKGDKFRAKVQKYSKDSNEYIKVRGYSSASKMADVNEKCYNSWYH